MAHALLDQLPDYDLAMATALEGGDATGAIDIAQNLYHALMRTQMGPMAGMSSIWRLLAELRWDEPNLGWPQLLPTATIVRALEFGCGWAFAMRGDRETAWQLAARAIAIDPTDSFARGFASRIALTSGEVDLAVEHAENRDSARAVTPFAGCWHRCTSATRSPPRGVSMRHARSPLSSPNGASGRSRQSVPCGPIC